MDEISQFTMEMFMNKNTYNRYIEKTDPNKHQDHKKFIRKTELYRDRIIKITMDYLNNPDMQVTIEMNDMFSDYCKTCIKYFELKDLEESSGDNYQKGNDEDVMFDPDEMTEDFESNYSNMAQTDKTRTKPMFMPIQPFNYIDQNEKWLAKSV